MSSDRPLGFSQQCKLEPAIVNLNEQIVDMMEPLRQALGEHVKLSTSMACNLSAIRTDAAQLQSAITSLATNVSNAMPRGGRFMMETRNIVLDGNHQDFHPGLKSGEYVQLSISDTRVAMPPDERGQLLGLTTKAERCTTGLNLAMVHSIVKQSGGHVTSIMGSFSAS